MFDGKDIDGKRQWVTLPDLTVLSGSWYKVDTDVTLPPNFICADFSHGFDGKDVDGKRQWVTLPDLTLLSGGWYKVDSDPHFTTSPCFP
jgi:phage tail tube protein FII